ncbi:MAG: hypothetical protein ACYTEZ_05430 [Planctomycetota bacterium]
MSRIATLLLLVTVACSSTSQGSDEPLLPPEPRAELEKFVDAQMGNLPGQVRLNETQIEDILPFVRAATRKIFEAAHAYHANPTASRLKRFNNEAQRIRGELRENITPLMTSAQLYNFLTVYDQALQEIRRLRLARG